MKPEAVASSSKSGSRSSSTVAFSWEQEPGVSKQGHSEATKDTAGGAPRAVAVSRRTPASAKKQAQAPAAAVTAHPHRHRLRVPPPPGVPGAPVTSPPGTRKPRSSSRRVRPADDPFLAAYLACCTEDGTNGGRRYTGAQKLLGWTGLGLGLGLGPLGRLGLSCKSSCGAVEECVIRLAKGTSSAKSNRTDKV